MKKLLNILTSFSIISTLGFKLISCEFKNDDSNDNNSVQIEKSNLQKAKYFFS